MSFKQKTDVYQSKLFILNKSQAVRIPKKIAFPEEIKAVTVVRRGASLILTPVHSTWDAWFDEEGVTEDYLARREQPEEQEREGL